MLFELGEGTKATIVYKHNEACVIWAEDEGKRDKHIDARYDECRKACDNKEVVFKYSQRQK